MKLIKRAVRLLALTMAIVPLVSCSLFNRYEKNDQGFYERHYWTCGPEALAKALGAYDTKRGIVYVRNPYTQKEISQKIQRKGMNAKELLSFFNKELICVTWPSDIRFVAKSYGFKLITVDDIDDLDLEKDIAIVLIHGRFFSKQYHWVVYPLDDVKDFYGKKTVIDAVYLLK